jgi:hypothetical protein
MVRTAWGGLYEHLTRKPLVSRRHEFDSSTLPTASRQIRRSARANLPWCGSGRRARNRRTSVTRWIAGAAPSLVGGGSIRLDSRCLSARAPSFPTLRRLELEHRIEPPLLRGRRRNAPKGADRGADDPWGGPETSPRLERRSWWQQFLTAPGSAKLAKRSPRSSCFIRIAFIRNLFVVLTSECDDTFSYCTPI